MKSHHAVAIGRQGNFLFWGFHASPEQLAPEARKCFVNAICYIREFEGQPVLVRDAGRYYPRQWIMDYAYNYMLCSDPEKAMELLSPAGQQDPAKAGKSALQIQQAMRKYFPAELPNDPMAILEYCRTNFEYFRGSDERRGVFVLDRDAKEVGISNRSIDLLDACVTMLERGERVEQAMRLLRRYTTQSLPGASAWRGWLEANRSRLYFTEVGGYKFLVAPLDHSAGPASEGLPFDDAVAVKNEARPVRASARFTAPNLAAGGETDLEVKLAIDPTWHVQVLDRTGESPLGTRIELELPAGVQAIGDWSSPEPGKVRDGRPILMGEAAFRRRIQITPEVRPGAIKAACRVTFQACDPFHSRARETITVEAGGRIGTTSP